jgi:hypothetical protein
MHDLGGDSNSNELDDFMEQIGAKFHTSPQGAHEKNPVAESNLLNMLIRSHDESASPFELLFGRKPPLHLLKPFGCRAVVHINKERREAGKLGARGRPGRYVGLNATNNTHLILLDAKDGSVGREVVEAVHVEFDTQGVMKWSPREVEEMSSQADQAAAGMPVRADEFARPDALGGRVHAERMIESGLYSGQRESAGVGIPQRSDAGGGERNGAQGDNGSMDEEKYSGAGELADSGASALADDGGGANTHARVDESHSVRPQPLESQERHEKWGWSAQRDDAGQERERVASFWG